MGGEQQKKQPNTAVYQLSRFNIQHWQSNALGLVMH